MSQSVEAPWEQQAAAVEDGLEPHQREALEAYADTVVPGERRFEGDRAVAGVGDGVGAVDCGAIAVLTHPATGIADGVGEMADLLNLRAGQYAQTRGIEVEDGHEFACLPYQERRALVAELTSRDEAEHDLWFLLALFSYMAYDSAPHRETSQVLLEPSGLVEMGFAGPAEGGRWKFDPAGYGRPLARLHPGTDEGGNPT